MLGFTEFISRNAKHVGCLVFRQDSRFQILSSGRHTAWRVQYPLIEESASHHRQGI